MPLLKKTLGLALIVLTTLIVQSNLSFMFDAFSSKTYVDTSNIFIDTILQFILFFLSGICLKEFKFYNILWWVCFVIVFALISAILYLALIGDAIYVESIIRIIAESYIDALIIPAVGVYVGWLLGYKLGLINRHLIIKVVILVLLAQVTIIGYVLLGFPFVYILNKIIYPLTSNTHIPIIEMFFPALIGMIELFLPFLFSGIMLKRFEFYNTWWAVFFALVSTYSVFALTIWTIYVESTFLTVAKYMQYLMPALGVYLGWLLGNKLGWGSKS